MSDRVERPARVLVANHHTSALADVEQRLAERGHAVTTSTHLVETIGQLGREPPDVIVFQPLTGALDGFEVRHVLEAGGEGREHAFVLILPEAPAGERIAEARFGPFDDFVVLPSTPELIVARVELAIARSRRFRELARAARLRERDAVTDFKTGLWNDRFFSQRLGEEVARSRRHGLALALIVLDLDHFKEINDRFDHVFGDHVLFEFAQKVRSVIRSIDIPARLGGDEFALLLPNTDLGEAVRLATRLREALAGHEFSKDGRSTRVTLSMGIDALRGDEGVDARQFLRQADAALFEAKRRGRNRICLWPEIAGSAAEKDAAGPA